MPASVVLSAVLGGVLLGFGLVESVRPDVQLAREIGAILAGNCQRARYRFRSELA